MCVNGAYIWKLRVAITFHIHVLLFTFTFHIQRFVCFSILTPPPCHALALWIPCGIRLVHETIYCTRYPQHNITCANSAKPHLLRKLHLSTKKTCRVVHGAPLGLASDTRDSCPQKIVDIDSQLHSWLWFTCEGGAD